MESNDYAYQNPQRTYGLLTIIFSSIVIVISFYWLGSIPRLIKLFSEAPNLSDSVIAASFSSLPNIIMAFLFGLVGLYGVISSLRYFGYKILPQGAPKEFSSYEGEVLIALKRKEMPIYSIPQSGPYRAAVRFFPDIFPLMPPIIRLFTKRSVSFFTLAMFLCFISVCFGVMTSVALQIEDLAILETIISPIPFYGFALWVFFASILQLVFVFVFFPKRPPRAESNEFLQKMNGVGNPSEIPHGLEHALLPIRMGNKPNRHHKVGFEQEEGGVENTGVFEGLMIVETQPVITENPHANLAYSSMIIGFVICFVSLFYLFNFGSSDITAAVMTIDSLMISQKEILSVGILWSYGSSIALGMILWMIGKRLITLGFGIMEASYWRSQICVLQANGTFSKSSITIGSGREDSIESSNLVVRSNISLQGYTADIISEGITINSKRHITEMLSNEEATTIENLLKDWLEDFRVKSNTISAIDLSDHGVQSIAQANMQIAEKRDQQKQIAIPAKPPAPSIAPQPTPVLNIFSSQDFKECPDCAEMIRFRARKCRFCGYIYQ